MLGLYVSSHPLVEVPKRIAGYRTPAGDRPAPIQHVLTLNDGSQVLALGVITNLEKRVSRRGNNWAKFQLQGSRSSIEVMLWGRNYTNVVDERGEDFLRDGQIVALYGRVDSDEPLDDPTSEEGVGDGSAQLEPTRRLIAERLFMVDVRSPARSVSDPPARSNEDAQPTPGLLKRPSQQSSKPPTIEKWLVVPTDGTLAPNLGAEQFVPDISEQWSAIVKSIRRAGDVKRVYAPDRSAGGILVVAEADHDKALKLATEKHPALTLQAAAPRSAAVPNATDADCVEGEAEIGCATDLASDQPTRPADDENEPKERRKPSKVYVSLLPAEEHRFFNGENMTLVYGKQHARKREIDGTYQRMRELVAEVARTEPPVTTKVTGKDLFGHRSDVPVLKLAGKRLPQLRSLFEEFANPRDGLGGTFSPHMRVALIDDDYDETIVFDRIRLKIGEDVLVLSLTGATKEHHHRGAA